MVLTVYPGDAAQLLQAEEHLVHGLIVDPVVISHIELKRRYLLLHHFFQFSADLFIPFRERKVEGIIAGRFPVRLPVPVLERLSQ